MKTKTILIIALTASLSACHKEQVNQKLHTQFSASGRLSTSAVAITPANPANPFDSIGYYHNLLLSNIQPCLLPFDPVTGTEITGCVIKIANQVHLNETDTQFSLVPMVVGDKRNDFRNIIAQCNYSSYTKIMMDSLIRVVKDAAINTEADYAAIKSVITNFEQPLLNNEHLSNYERQTLLSITSVARYSIYYWLQLEAAKQGLSLKRIAAIVATAMTDAVSLAVVRSAGFAADSSEEAWFDMNYYIPGN